MIHRVIFAAIFAYLVIYPATQESGEKTPLDASISLSLQGASFKEAFGGPCEFNRRCAIMRNPGGKLHVFQNAAREVLDGYADKVAIDGECYSGCVMFADLAREKVCLTPMARMFVHKSIRRSPFTFLSVEVVFIIRSDPPHAQDIMAWAQANNGFPSEGFLEMGHDIKSKIWKSC